MAPAETGKTEDGRDWPPCEHALNYSKWVDPANAAPPVIMLTHPTAPFVAQPIGDLTDKSVQNAGYEYLAAANKYFEKVFKNGGLGLPGTWLNDLCPNSKSSVFGWLPFDPPPAAPFDAVPKADPSQASSSLVRDAGNGRTDRTLLLCASERFPDGTFLGSEFGICIVLEVVDLEAGNEIQIVGMTASLPFGPYNGEVSNGERGEKPLDAALSYIRESKKEIATALRLQPKTVFYRGSRVAALRDRPEILIELRGTGLGAVVDRSGRPTPFGFVAAVRRSEEGETLNISTLTRAALVTHAAPGTARVFCQDPQSSRIGSDRWRLRRPTRDEATLDAYRHEEEICGADPCPLGNLNVQIMSCWRFVRADSRTNALKSVPLPGNAFPPVRSNDFSAVSAFHYTNELFCRMRRYGFDPAGYFRAGQLPLEVHYRSGVRPGPGKDGQTVNARVTGKGWPADFFGDYRSNARPVVELHLALGNLSRRARGRWTGTQRADTRPEKTEVEPLGIASDRRWMWHEFGHVLLMAAFGELEFRFAHSPGDALAAIVADPYSGLVDREGAYNRPRGSTFPWVFLPRRHDRCVTNGWSWSGSMHRAVARLPDAEKRRFKGYRSEQILSTTLFRLYRSLGGDTTEIFAGKKQPDRAVRELASHYVVYLVMKAIRMCCVPPMRADQFAQRMILADSTTRNPFVVCLKADKPEEGDEPGEKCRKQGIRIGGCAHKVVRWAFEAQGMYAADGNAINNAPGAPPPVDIYIRDRRPLTETTEGGDVTYATPGYVPVSLDWRDVPRWHATNDAIRLEAGGFHVAVGNRGGETAGGVSVRVWWLARPANLEGLEWDAGAGWNECNPSSPPPKKDVPSGGTVDFGPFTGHPTAPGEYLVFAQATCVDDRANSDQTTGLPCSLPATPLVDLVAGDNNLGLRIIDIP